MGQITTMPAAACIIVLSLAGGLMPLAGHASGPLRAGGGDADGDTVADAIDNCGLVANLDQRDTDGDGFGNMCDADFNNDLQVNATDLGVLKSVFFSADADADLDGDGSVNVVDLGIMRRLFFQPPGPMGIAAIFDNGDPTEGFGVTVVSGVASGNQIAEEFVLAESAPITSLQWWGSSGEHNFRIRIFAFDNGIPRLTPEHDIDVGPVVGVPQLFPGGELSSFAVGVTGLALSSGIYMISIVAEGVQTWFWAASCEDGCEGDSWRRGADGDLWNIGNWRFAFRLFTDPLENAF